MPWRTVLFDALPAECYSLSVLEVFSADRCHYLGFTVGASPWVIPPRSVSKMYPVTKAVAQRYMRLCLTLETVMYDALSEGSYECVLDVIHEAVKLNAFLRIQLAMLESATELAAIGTVT